MNGLARMSQQEMTFAIIIREGTDILIPKARVVATSWQFPVGKLPTWSKTPIHSNYASPFASVPIIGFQETQTKEASFA